MASESTLKTITVALLVTVVSSVLVSGTVVALKPLQEKNKKEEKKKNVLLASGVYNKDKSIDEQFARFDPLLVDLSSGKPSEEKISPDDYEMKKMLKSPDTSISLTSQQDIAGIRTIPKLMMVYLLKKDGELKNIILPIYGKGLWSTMYGFLVLEGDFNTIKGITFYEHGETPGLGGEIDNPKWKAIWQGKHLFDKAKFAFEVLKGSVSPQDPMKLYHVDGLSGATLTRNGVNNTVRFWFGNDGYGKFLTYLKEQSSQNKPQTEKPEKEKEGAINE